MGENDHPNARRQAEAVVIDTLPGGSSLVGHVIPDGAWAATLVYTDGDGNVGVNLLAAHRRPAKLLSQLVNAMRELDVVHPAPELLAAKVLAVAGRAAK